MNTNSRSMGGTKLAGIQPKAQSQMTPSMLGEQTKSTNIANRPFDEALEFSHEEESGESIDTRTSHKKKGGLTPPDKGGHKGKNNEIKSLGANPGGQSGVGSGNRNPAPMTSAPGGGGQGGKPQQIAGLPVSKRPSIRNNLCDLFVN